MDLLGALNPAASQAQQRQHASALEYQQALEMANALRNEVLEPERITSPWQAAGKIAQALGANLQMGRARDLQQQGAASSGAALTRAYEAYLRPSTSGADGGAASGAPGVGAGGPGNGDINPPAPSASSSGPVGSPDDVAAIQKTASDLQIDPRTLTAVLGYESGFNPRAVGDSGKGYPVKGLIGFDPDNVKRYGEPAPTIAGQMPQVAQYLLDRGWKPGVYSPTDLPRLYSIVNAGSLDASGNPRLGAADVNGTVGEHVARIARSQFGPADRFLSGGSPPQPSTGAPGNVADTIKVLSGGADIPLALTDPSSPAVANPAVAATANALSPGAVPRPAVPGPSPASLVAAASSPSAVPGAPAAAKTPLPTPTPGPQGAPPGAAPVSPGAMAQPSASGAPRPLPGNPGAGQLAAGGLPSPLTAPIGQMSRDDLQNILSNTWIPDATKAAVLTMIQQRASPQTMDVEGGKLMYDAAGRKAFIPEPRFSKMKLGADTEIDVVSHFDPQTGRWTSAPMVPGGPGGSTGVTPAGATPGPTGTPAVFQGGVPPFPTTGNLSDIVAWSAAIAANKAGAEESAKKGMEVAWEPVKDALVRGKTATQEVQMLDAMDTLSKQNPALLSGPLAPTFLTVAKGVNELTGGALGLDKVTASAEGIDKLSNALTSLAVREISNRPALAEFKTVMGANPNLTNTPEGRTMLIGIMRQTAAQDAEIARRAEVMQDPRELSAIRDQVYHDMPLTITYGGKTYPISHEGMAQLGTDVKATSGGGAPGGAPGASAPAAGAAAAGGPRVRRYNPSTGAIE
jgi:hypothetical protein